MESPRLVYSLFMVLAAIAFLVARRLSPTPAAVAALPVGHKLLLGWAAFAGGVLGAKVPFVFGGDGFFAVSTWTADGKTITTALIGGYVAVELMKLLLGIRFKTGDAWALPLALALAVGRCGCYCNGCCVGTPSELPWAVDFGDGVRRHPTQAYESLFHLAMVWILFQLQVRNRFVGHRLQLYLIAYGAFRFFIEWIRPEPRDYGGLTYYQWAAVILVVGPAFQWLWESTRQGKAGGIVD